jgi:hypothetical protein
LGLWRESEAFLRRQVATVFENSTACVKRRDLTTSVVGLKLTRLSSRVVPCRTSVWLGVLRRRTFELKLKSERVVQPASTIGRIDTSSFTESLILAQDERWRRA